MKTTRLRWIAVILFTAAPGLLRAQTASLDSPNTPAAAPCVAPQNVPGAGLPAQPRLSLTVRAQDPGGVDLPRVDVNPPNAVVLTACDNGLAVANKSMDGIHAAAIAQGYTCAALSGTCGGSVAGGTAEQIWRFTAPGASCGFTLTKAFGAASTSVTVSGMAPGCLPRSVRSQTNAGNPSGVDMLNYYLVQVLPNGVFGQVDFSVHHLQGGLNPRTFSVSIGADHNANYDAIKAGFDGTGLGLLSMNTRGGVQIGNMVSAQVTQVDVDAQSGQIVTQEVSDVRIGPALSPWAMVLLIALLLFTGYWILRRHHGFLAGTAEAR